MYTLIKREGITIKMNINAIPLYIYTQNNRAAYANVQYFKIKAFDYVKI